MNIQPLRFSPFPLRKDDETIEFERFSFDCLTADGQRAICRSPYILALERGGQTYTARRCREKKYSELRRLLRIFQDHTSSGCMKETLAKPCCTMQMDIPVKDVPLSGVHVDIQEIAVEVEWKSLVNDVYRGEDIIRIMCWLR